MSKDQRKTPKSKTRSAATTITITGNQNAVATQGGKASIMHIEENISSDYRAWRKEIERKIDSLQNLPEEDKSLLKQNTEQIVQEAEKGQQADASRIERLLNTVSVMAPDIFDVAITTLGNPLAGIGLVIKKIGDKAKVIRKA